MYVCTDIRTCSLEPPFWSVRSVGIVIDCVNTFCKFTTIYQHPGNVLLYPAWYNCADCTTFSLAKWPDLLGRSLSALKGFVCHRSCTRNPMLHIFNHTVSYLHSMDLFLSTLSGSNMSEQEMIQRHGNHICPQHMVLKVSNNSVVSDTPWETLQLVSLELQQNIPS